MHFIPLYRPTFNQEVRSICSFKIYYPFTTITIINQKSMNSKTQQMVNAIKSKAKNTITNKMEFKDKDEVLELAVTELHERLKKDKLL